MKSNKQKTYQRLINGDARDLSFLSDESIHLVVTSPPYWNLKRYNENPDQLGHVNDYESFNPTDSDEVKTNKGVKSALDSCVILARVKSRLDPITMNLTPS